MADTIIWTGDTVHIASSIQGNAPFQLSWTPTNSLSFLFFGRAPRAANAARGSYPSVLAVARAYGPGPCGPARRATHAFLAM
jgi:hypothetical protein